MNELENTADMVAQGVGNAIPSRLAYKVFEKKDYESWLAAGSSEPSKENFQQWLNVLAFNGWDLVSLSTEEMDFSLLARR